MGFEWRLQVVPGKARAEEDRKSYVRASTSLAFQAVWGDDIGPRQQISELK